MLRVRCAAEGDLSRVHYSSRCYRVMSISDSDDDSMVVEEDEKDIQDEKEEEALIKYISKEMFIALHIETNTSPSLSLKEKIQRASAQYNQLKVSSHNALEIPAAGKEIFKFSDLVHLDIANMDSMAAGDYLKALFYNICKSGPDPSYIVGTSWMTLVHDEYTAIVNCLFLLYEKSIKSLNRLSSPYIMFYKIFKQLVATINNLYSLALRSRCYHSGRLQMSVLEEDLLMESKDHSSFLSDDSRSGTLCALNNTTMYNDFGVQLQHAGKEIYNKSVSIEQHVLAMIVAGRFLHDGVNIYEPVNIFVRKQDGRKEFVATGAYRLFNMSQWTECTPFEALCQRRSRESSIENWIATRAKNFLPPDLAGYVNIKALAASIAGITSPNMRYNGNFYTYVVDKHGHIYDSWTMCMRRPGETTTMKKQKGQPLLVQGDGEELYRKIMGYSGSDVFNFFDGKWYKETMESNFWYTVASYQIPSRYTQSNVPVVPEVAEEYDDDLQESNNYWGNDNNQYGENERTLRLYDHQAMIIKSQLAVYGRTLHYPRTFDEYPWIIVHHGESGTGKSTRMWMQALMFHPGQYIQIDSRPGSSRQEFGGARKCNARGVQVTEVDSKSTLKRGFFLESASGGSVEVNEKNKEIRSMKFLGHIEMGQNQPPYKALISEYPSAWLRRQPCQSTFYYTRRVREDMNDESSTWEAKSLILTIHAESVSLFSALLTCNGQPLHKILYPQYDTIDHINQVLAESIESQFLSTGALRRKKGSLLPLSVLNDYFVAYIGLRKLYAKNGNKLTIANWENLQRLTGCELVTLTRDDVRNINSTLHSMSTDQKNRKNIEIVSDGILFIGSQKAPVLRGIRYPPLEGCELIHPSQYYKMVKGGSSSTSADDQGSMMDNKEFDRVPDIWKWKTSREACDMFITGLAVGPGAINTTSYARVMVGSGFESNSTAVHNFYDLTDEIDDVQRNGRKVYKLSSKALGTMRPKEVEAYSTYLEISNCVPYIAKEQVEKLIEQKIQDSLPRWTKLHRYLTLQPSFIKNSALLSFVRYRRYTDFATGKTKYKRVDSNKIRPSLGYRSLDEINAWEIIRAHVDFKVDQSNRLKLLCVIKKMSDHVLWQGDKWESNIMHLVRICDVLAERYHRRMNYSAHSKKIDARNALMAFCYKAKLASAALEQHASLCRSIHV